MGGKTEESCNGLRLQLGKGADPWFDYHSEYTKSEPRKVSNAVTSDRVKAKLKNSVAFRSLGRDQLSKSLPPSLVYRVKYDLVAPRAPIIFIMPPGRSKSASSALDLAYHLVDGYKPRVPKFDRYTSRRPLGKQTMWDVRDPLGQGLSERCAVDIANQLPRSYFDKELVSYYEPGKYQLPDSSVRVPSFKRMTRPGDHIHARDLRSTDFQPPLDGNRRILPVFIGDKSRKTQPLVVHESLVDLHPQPEHYFY